MRIAFIGTRGVPARYGGFETAVEEIGKRLAGWGHEVTVYSRGPRAMSRYLGMEVVNLPTLRLKVTDTLAHTALSVAHAAFTRGYDAALVFNAANAPLARFLKLRGIPYALHVDGLEWQRLKWGRLGRRYYLRCEVLGTKTANALISDAKAIQEYYVERYDSESVYIAYGAPPPVIGPPARLEGLGLVPAEFHLVVARFEPENYVDLAVSGFVQSAATYPLVVVGGAPYGAEYTRKIHGAANQDPRVHFLGSVWDQDLLNELYAHCRSYIHGHSVGGTNPSLLRAMGLGAAVLANGVVFNREVLGPEGKYFADGLELARLLEWSEREPLETRTYASGRQARARALFDWDEVARRYEWLCHELQEAGPRGYVVDRHLDIADVGD